VMAFPCYQLFRALAPTSQPSPLPASTMVQNTQPPCGASSDTPRSTVPAAVEPTASTPTVSSRPSSTCTPKG
jgi:hypothetical protein